MSKKERKLSKKLVVPAAMMRSFVMGFKGSITNIFILDIAASFGLSTGELGGMLTANHLAGVVVPLIVGRVSDLLGKKLVIILSMIIAVIGSLLIAWAPTVEIYVIGTIIMGIGNTASNGAVTPALADLYPDKAQRYISLMHVVISIATMIGPILLMTMAGSLGLTWRIALCGIAILTIVPLAMVSLSDIPKPEGVKTAKNMKEMFALLRDPALVIGSLSLLFYCATDNIYAPFLSILFEEKFSAIELGSLALSLHGAMYAIARFLIGYVKKSTKALGVLTLSISALSLIMVTIVKDPVWAVVFCALYSLSFAPLYSVMVSQTALAYPGNSGTATSLMFFGGSLGGLIFSDPASKLAGSFGVDWAFYLLAGLAFMAMVLFIVYSNKLKKSEQQ